MIRSKILRSFLLLTALILTSQAVLATYTVVLKDGTLIVATEKYEVQGDRALIQRENGTPTTVRLSEIDVDKTEEYNSRRNLAGVVVVDGNSTRPLELGEAPPMNLNEALRRKKQRERAREEAPPRMVKTSAGYNDLTRIQRRPYRESEISKRMTEELRKAGIREFEIHQGTTDNRVFLYLTTNDEKEVFKALRVSANTYGLIHELDRTIEAFEVLMMTGTKTRAGQFLLDDENTPLLINQKMSVSDFFVEYVQF